MTSKEIISAPGTKSIIRDSDGQDHKIVIQSLTEQHFDEARRIENAFFGTGVLHQQGNLNPSIEMIPIGDLRMELQLDNLIRR
jgi:hypothetical protein